jgi:hypothetical protein
MSEIAGNRMMECTKWEPVLNVVTS